MWNAYKTFWSVKNSNLRDSRCVPRPALRSGAPLLKANVFDKLKDYLETNYSTQSPPAYKAAEKAQDRMRTCFPPHTHTHTTFNDLPGLTVFNFTGLLQFFISVCTSYKGNPEMERFSTSSSSSPSFNFPSLENTRFSLTWPM